MVSTHTLFEWLVGLHIATGTVGLIVVWIPIAGKKGVRCIAAPAPCSCNR